MARTASEGASAWRLRAFVGVASPRHVRPPSADDLATKDSRRERETRTVTAAEASLTAGLREIIDTEDLAGFVGPPNSRRCVCCARQTGHSTTPWRPAGPSPSVTFSPTGLVSPTARFASADRSGLRRGARRRHRQPRRTGRLGGGARHPAPHRSSRRALPLRAFHRPPRFPPRPDRRDHPRRGPPATHLRAAGHVRDRVHGAGRAITPAGTDGYQPWFDHAWWLHPDQRRVAIEQAQAAPHSTSKFPSHSSLPPYGMAAADQSRRHFPMWIPPACGARAA